MKYQVLFPDKSCQNKFEKKLKKIPQEKLREKIMIAIEELASNPMPEGKKFKFLKPPILLFKHTAHYRLRISNYRALYDIDRAGRKVWILALRSRSGKTYKS